MAHPDGVTLYDLGDQGVYSEAGILSGLRTFLSLHPRISMEAIIEECIEVPRLVLMRCMRELERTRVIRKHRGKWEYIGGR